MASQPPAKMTMARRAAEKKTSFLVSAFAGVSQLSVDQELAYVGEELRKNPQLLFAVSGLMKSQSLQALLDGRAMNLKEQQDEDAEELRRQAKLLKLRRSAVKWGHLKHQPAIVEGLLKVLAPAWFREGVAPLPFASRLYCVATRSVSSVSRCRFSV